MEKEYWNKTLIYPVFIFALVVILTIPFSRVIAVSLRGAISLFSALFSYLFMYSMTVQDRYSYTRIFKYFTGVFIILSIYGIIEYLLGFNVLRSISTEVNVFEDCRVVGSFQRVRTVYYQPSRYAFVILVFIPLYIHYVINYGKRIYLFILGLLVINLILTFTRIAWIAFVVQIIGSLLLFKSKKSFVMSLLIVAISSPFWGLILNRLGIMDKSAQQRAELFQFGLDLFKASPFYGCGLASFYELSINHFEDKIAAHGDYMLMFAETGIFGGASYLILLFSNLIFSIKNLGKSDFAKVAFLTIIGFMVFSVTDNSLSYSHVFWALLGIYNGLIVRDYSKKHSFCLQLIQPLKRRQMRLVD